jgi:Spy/CpxP family protein refolding chaperone
MTQESRQKAGLWLAVVFVLGAAIGGVFGYSFSQHHTLAASSPAPQLSEPERRNRRVAEMTKELSLTPEQASSFDGIIHHAHDEIKVLRDKCEADVDAVRLQARDQMRQMLTPEQKPKFEEMVQRMDAEHKKQQSQAPPQK